MITAAAIQHPHRYLTRLVQQGVKLDHETIRRLIELKVPHAWISHPLMDDLDDRLLSNVPERRRGMYETIKKGFNDLQNRAITTDDYRHYCGVISSLVNELVGRDGRAADMAERLFDEGDELSNHCSNVAYLAVNIGMHLESYIIRERQNTAVRIAKDLTSLGVGAMLHDMGKLQCDPAIRAQHEFSTPKHATYPEHARAGYEMLRERINPVASTIALHHHQRWDGTGFPDMTAITRGRHTGGFSGHKIHIFARIVAAANVFDNLTNPPEGPIRPGIYALHRFQSPEMASRFDPVVLDAMLRYLPPFPTGVQVFLNDGRMAAVSALNPDQPCRPKIRYIDEMADGQDVDLTEHLELHISESQGVSVERWLYHLPSKQEAMEAALADTIV
jgi:HD-GYP domain-containing protein (c-di-GMP phosphodiesterase class II)